VATKSAQEPVKGEVIEELLDALDTSLDRVKVLYEQYFLGIQKQPPTFLHTDVERKIRDLAQIQIRNTALRYRFVTIQQKFGSYNSYWRRTLRQIENGTYARSLSKIGRQAARTGAAVPEEILAAMPKRMRDQVKRDREAALALARLRDKPHEDPEIQAPADEDVDVDDLDRAVFIGESSAVRRNLLTEAGAHRIDEADADFDLDAFFAAVTSEDEPPTMESYRRAAGAAARTTRPSSPALDLPPDHQRTVPCPPPEDLGIEPAPPAGPAASSPAGFLAESPVQDPRRAPPPGSGRPGTRRTPSDPPRARAASQLPGAGPSKAGRAATAQPSGGQPGSRAVPPVPLPGQPPKAQPPKIPPVATTGMMPAVPRGPGSLASQGTPPAPIRSVVPAPSQATRPVPVMPGSLGARAPAVVETLAGPFPRLPKLPPLPIEQASMTAPMPMPAPMPAIERPSDAPNSRASTAQPPPAERAQATGAIPVIERKPGAANGRRSTSRPPAPSSERPPVPTSARPPVPAAPPPVPLPPAPPSPARTPSDCTPIVRPPPPPVSPPSVAPRVPPKPRRTPEPRPAPPLGMSDADVNALYAKYVQAKQLLGEEAGPGAYGKLLKTINAQAPKIMEQYKSRGVDFSIVVKDNQVIIRAKPKP